MSITSQASNSVLLKLTIAFDGTAYAGWQVQKTGLGVQEKVQQAARCLFPSAGSVQGSSRTDAGVHALGMVAHVEIPRGQLKMPVRKVSLALNAFLPEDIRVVAVTRCREPFHARFDAVGKEYRYSIWNHRTMNPLLRRTAWHVPKPLDLSAMRAAAGRLVGRHNFRSFSGHRAGILGSATRTILRCQIRKSGPLLSVIIEGDGFLYKMCRTIVGTLVQIGHGKYEPSDVGRMLARKDRRAAGMTAPAHGLVLWKVFYGRKAKRPVTGRARHEMPD